MLKYILLLLAMFLSFAASARDPAEKHAFVHMHPCPATGKSHGACPGWVVDHIIPLCAGGPDLPSNMQWQTKADGLAKDKLEWRQCRKLHKH